VKEQESNTSIRRILIALDASAASRRMIQTAVELAAELDAEVIGLFVEDVNLLRLADSPLMREIGSFSTARRNVDVARLERQFRAQASQLRRALMQLATQRRVAYRFQVTRGAVAPEIAKATTEADLIILDKAGWSAMRRRKLGEVSRTLLTQAPNLTLVVQEDARLHLPIFLVYDGTASSQRALVTAARLLQEDIGQLTILLAANDPGHAVQLQRETASWLGARGLAAYYRQLPTQNIRNRLTHLAVSQHVGLMVLPGPKGVLDDEDLADLLDRLDCPVLLVR
jgi:nucleotide-binding universal stress UspA family protein